MLRRKQKVQRNDSQDNFLTWLGVMGALGVVIGIVYYADPNPNKESWRFDLFSFVVNGD